VLAYIALGSTAGIKALLTSFLGTALDSLDERKLLKIKNSYIELEVSPLDLVCFVLSCLSVAVYLISRSWIYNNMIAIVFCIHALQSIFLGNFKTGALLLSLLFFYDIFFVFGTDVMVTVASNIDAPIKLQFPRNLAADPPQYSILGLGDIVIPGIFVSMCLRFDVLKQINNEKLGQMIEGERKGKGSVEDNATIKYLIATARAAPKTYFYAVIVGYLVAIITTVVIMLVFNHGQPALLYLVPGCLGSVFGLAALKGEFGLIWNHNEEKYVKPKEE
jgi:minor histocompatibility antigen H13